MKRNRCPQSWRGCIKALSLCATAGGSGPRPLTPFLQSLASVCPPQLYPRPAPQTPPIKGPANGSVANPNLLRGWGHCTHNLSFQHNSTVISTLFRIHVLPMSYSFIY